MELLETLLIAFALWSLGVLSLALVFVYIVKQDDKKKAAEKKHFDEALAQAGPILRDPQTNIMS